MTRKTFNLMKVISFDSLFPLINRCEYNRLVPPRNYSLYDYTQKTIIRQIQILCKKFTTYMPMCNCSFDKKYRM